MITSRQNPQIQQVRRLLEKASERQETGRYVIEGVRLVEEAARRSAPVETLFYDESLSARGMSVVETLTGRGVTAIEVSPAVSAGLSGTETPQGLLAVLPLPRPALPAPLDFVVVLDTLRDPGNLGTILRTAAAAGVQAALLSPGCADAYAPKVLRAAMGAHFYIPILTAASWDELGQWLNDQHTGQALTVIESDPLAGTTLWDADFRRPLAVMISNEASGTSAEGRRLATQSVSIPMPGHFESLNAAIAAGILLFEIIRQREHPCASDPSPVS